MDFAPSHIVTPPMVKVMSKIPGWNVNPLWNISTFWL